MTNASLKPQPKQDFPHQKKLNIQTPIISKSMNYNRKQSKLRHSNAKERISEGAKSFNAKDASFLSSAPVLDTNIKDRIRSGKEATKRSTITPFFDLNQISVITNCLFDATLALLVYGCFIAVGLYLHLFLMQQREEEELLVDFEPMKGDEPRRSSQRGASDEQHGDIKLLACRNIGNGSIRTGKKKISWQDQVELRV